MIKRKTRLEKGKKMNKIAATENTGKKEIHGNKQIEKRNGGQCQGEYEN